MERSIQLFGKRIPVTAVDEANKRRRQADKAADEDPIELLHPTIMFLINQFKNQQKVQSVRGYILGMKDYPSTGLKTQMAPVICLSDGTASIICVANVSAVRSHQLSVGDYIEFVNAVVVQVLPLMAMYSLNAEKYTALHNWMLDVSHARLQMVRKAPDAMLPRYFLASNVFNLLPFSLVSVLIRLDEFVDDGKKRIQIMGWDATDVRVEILCGGSFYKLVCSYRDRFYMNFAKGNETYMKVDWARVCEYYSLDVDDGVARLLLTDQPVVSWLGDDYKGGSHKGNKRKPNARFYFFVDEEFGSVQEEFVKMKAEAKHSCLLYNKGN